MKHIALGLVLLSSIAFTSCGIFKKKCNCPKFGYEQPTHGDHFAQQPEKNVESHGRASVGE